MTTTATTAQFYPGIFKNPQECRYECGLLESWINSNHCCYIIVAFFFGIFPVCQEDTCGVRKHLGCLVENKVSPCSRGEAVEQHWQCMFCSKKLHGSALAIGNGNQGLDSLMWVLWSLLISYFGFDWLQFYCSIWIRMKSVKFRMS